jgi:hypothetical protein
MGSHQKLPSNVPGYTLARLAVDKAHQGQGSSALILAIPIKNIPD